MRRNLLVIPAFAAGLVAVACQPSPPAPPPKVCTPITEAENNSVVNGASLAEVQAALGGKTLTLESRYETPSFPGPGNDVWESYTWSQTFAENGCYQSAMYSFENGGLVTSYWSKVVK